jgi:hypothetical protein
MAMAMAAAAAGTAGGVLGRGVVGTQDGTVLCQDTPELVLTHLEQEEVGLACGGEVRERPSEILLTADATCVVIVVIIVVVVVVVVAAAAGRFLGGCGRAAGHLDSAARETAESADFDAGGGCAASATASASATIALCGLGEDVLTGGLERHRRCAVGGRVR